MATIGLDDARAGIAGLLDRDERGEDVLIIGELRSAPKPAAGVTMDELLRPLDDLRNSLPPSSRPSADVLREIRGEGY